MIVNQKIEIKLNKEDSLILDSQSRMCSKLYNILLEKVRNGNEIDFDLLKGRNLRNKAIEVKQEHRYLYSVHSSPLKNAAIRLKQSFEAYFKSENKTIKMPKFHSNKKKWFSLLYDEPNKGIKIDNRRIKISLGYILEEDKKKRLYINGELKENIKSKLIHCFRITKELNKYYLIVTLEIQDKPKREIKKIISIDPNHANFFVGIDNEGKSIEVKKISMIKYFDLQIDKVKSKRDMCLKKSKRCVNKEGKEYYLPSGRYERLDKALSKLYRKRESQLKTAMYSISHYLCERYDKVAIGDYVPSLDTAKYKTMHRAMLNQSPIGMFRRILSYVCEKTGTSFEIVNERDTTKTCSFCGYIESHDPSIRQFECPNCHKLLYRDINSAINIGKKINLLSSSDYEGLDLSKPLYTEFYSYLKNCKIWN